MSELGALPATSETLPAPEQALTEPRAVVTWEGPGEPIVLTLYGTEGEVAMPLLPKRALELAKDMQSD